MRMRSSQQLDSMERHQKELTRSDPANCKDTGTKYGHDTSLTALHSRSGRRRESVVTFDISEVREESDYHLTVRDVKEEGEKTIFSWGSRRMSAPELPPIGKTQGGRNNSRTRNGYKKLSKNHSSGSLAEGQNQSPLSQLSSSSGLSNRAGHTSGASTGSPSRPSTSFCPSTDQLSAIGSSGNVKLETLFEKRNGMTLSSPRTTTAVSGLITQTKGKRSTLLDKNHNLNFDKTSIGMSDTKIPPRTKRGMRHSSSESQFLPISHLSSGTRSIRKFQRTGTSSVSNNNSNVNNGFGTLSRNSSDQKIKDKTKNSRNSQLDRRKIGVGQIEPLVKRSFNNGTVNGMRRYSSTFALNVQGRSNSREEIENDGVESDPDEENHRRILDWLIGADDAEVPADAEINYTEAPPQTDTAIHVVYNGD